MDTLKNPGLSDTRRTKLEKERDNLKLEFEELTRKTKELKNKVISSPASKENTRAN